MIEIFEIMYLFVWVAFIITIFFTLLLFVKNKKKIVRWFEGIGYIALLFSVVWNIIYEISKNTIDVGQYLILKEQVLNIWIYISHLNLFLMHQNVDLISQYNSLNDHLQSLKIGEEHAREQYAFAKGIQYFLAIVATSGTAIGKLYDLAYEKKEDINNPIHSTPEVSHIETNVLKVEQENNAAEQKNISNTSNSYIYKYTLGVFKDMYYHELTTKEALNSRVSVPLTTLSIIATLIIYYISKSESLPNLTISSVMLCMYYVITIVVICLIVYAAILLLLVFHGHKYAQSPSPKVIDNYVKRLDETYASCSEEEKKGIVEREFNSFFNDLYRDATEDNCKNNHSKIKNIRKCNICIIVALILCILNAIPLFILSKL